MAEDTIWVFAYGSLIYRPDFGYLDRQPARVKGWARRFWQGSHDHRGMPDAPGRVVTLVADEKGYCEGVAYQVRPDVFDYLDHREKNGYSRVTMSIELNRASSVMGVVYVADQHNFAYLGPAAMSDIAEHIRRSAGPSGANIDYLLDLAAALKALNIEDPHVFELALLLQST